MTKRQNKARQENWNGMNWISQKKRLAIYLRDGLCCAYCGTTAESGTQLSLDHLRACAEARKPDNRETNLITCCLSCNQKRGKRKLFEFCEAVQALERPGRAASDIIQHIVKCKSQDLAPFKAQAEQMLKLRGGSAKRALEAMEKTI